MTILTTIQHCCLELSLPEPTQVVGSNDRTVKELFQHAIRTGDELISKYNWSQLQRQHNVTLVNNNDAYSLPRDFDRFINRTQWDQSEQWELIGPLSPQEWQWFQNGVVSAFPRRRFRVKGFEGDALSNATEQFFVDPTPGTDDNNKVLVFEYQSKNWCRPVIWQSNTVFAAGSYCIGPTQDVYMTTAGGTTGNIPPTHTSGTQSDPLVSWTYVEAPYNRFLADSDSAMFDEQILELGIQWRFLRSKGLQYLEIKTEYEDMAERQSMAMKGAPTLSMSPRVKPRFIGPENVSDTGFGN